MTKLSQCNTCAVGNGVDCQHYKPLDNGECKKYKYDGSVQSGIKEEEYGGVLIVIAINVPIIIYGCYEYLTGNEIPINHFTILCAILWIVLMGAIIVKYPKIISQIMERESDKETIEPHNNTLELQEEQSGFPDAQQTDNETTEKSNESHQLKTEESMNEIKLSPRQFMRKPELVWDVLKELGCTPQIDENKDICFNYQGCRFVVVADNDYKMIDILLPWMEVFPLTELETVKTVINNTNSCQYVRYMYTVDNEESTVILHMAAAILFIVEIPELEKYLTYVLNGFFTSYRNIFKTQIVSINTKKNTFGLN